MTKIATILFAAICLFGMTACGDLNANKTTVIKKETKIDGDGNEKTRIETKTVETDERHKDGSVTHERNVDEKDPIVKLGPVEIRKN